MNGEQITTKNTVSNVALAAALLAVDIPMTAPPATYTGDGITGPGNITWTFGTTSADGKRDLRRCLALWSDEAWQRNPLPAGDAALVPYLPLAYCRRAWKNRNALMDNIDTGTRLYMHPVPIGDTPVHMLRVTASPLTGATPLPMSDARLDGLAVVETAATDLTAAALAMGVPLLGCRRALDGSTIWQLHPGEFMGGYSARGIAARWQDWPWLQRPGNNDPVATLAIASHNRGRLLKLIHEAVNPMVVARTGNRYALFSARASDKALAVVSRHLAHK